MSVRRQTNRSAAPRPVEGPEVSVFVVGDDPRSAEFFAGTVRQAPWGAIRHPRFRRPAENESAAAIRAAVLRLAEKFREETGRVARHNYA